MKKLFFLGFVGLMVVSCSKEDQREVAQEVKSSTPIELAAIAPNKDFNEDAGDDGELCSDGSANCTGIDIVGGVPSQFIDLMDEIDLGTEQSYLQGISTADLNVLTQNDGTVEKYYNDVKNGKRNISYGVLSGTSATDAYYFQFDACSTCTETGALDQVIRS